MEIHGVNTNVGYLDQLKNDDDEIFDLDLRVQDIKSKTMRDGFTECSNTCACSGTCSFGNSC